jgi:hypothetical protein
MRGRLTTVVVCVSDQFIVNEIPCACSVPSRSPISGTLAVTVGQLRTGQSTNTFWSLTGVRS